jgi:large subunit ribosomal protein L6
MSRVANNPVPIPDKVEVTIHAAEISVKGPLGALSSKLAPGVLVKKVENRIEFAAHDGSQQANALSGTMRALVSNMVYPRVLRRNWHWSAWVIARRRRATN